MVIALGASLLTSAVVMGVTAVVSRRIRRVAVVDVAWGLAFAAIAVVEVLIAAVITDEVWPSAVLALLVVGWGGRLAWHIRRRAVGEGEDPRYATLLGDDPWTKPGRVIGRVFLTQGVAAWLVSAPLAVAAALSLDWPALVWVGLIVGVVGVLFEAVGDAQLAAYRARPRDQRPPVMDRGLWAWTRHPNYFGDACVWWGVWLAGAAACGWLPGLSTIIGPIAMTYFLVFATGARLLERTMMQRPGYPAYAARTSMFIPLPPRRART